MGTRQQTIQKQEDSLMKQIPQGTLSSFGRFGGHTQMKSEPTGVKARGIIFTSNESATAASACPGLCAPETPLYRRMVFMRKRNHRIVFYLDDTEYNALERKVKMTSLSREGFIRKAIQNAQYLIFISVENNYVKSVVLQRCSMTC